MGSAYRYGQPSPHTYPPYYWAPPNVARPQPIYTAPWPEPYYCYRESPGHYYWPPHDWGYKYGGGPYWHCPPEYEFSRPKFSNYEGDGRDFRPYSYVPPRSPFVYNRPFNPSEQFRHPDDYPMRFVPATGYDRFGPYPSQWHCCGWPNQVFYPKPFERTSDEPVDAKLIKDSKDIDGKWTTDDNGKKRSENLQELPEPIVWIPGSLSDRNEEKHPVYWVYPKPLERRSDDPADEKRIKDCKDIDGKGMTDDAGKKRSENLQELPESTAWIPRSLADRNEEKYPMYLVPWNRKSTEGDRERPCPGYWVPLDSKTGPRDRKIEDEKAKLPPFPIFWIPTKFEGEGDAKVENPLQEIKKTEGRDASKVENLHQKAMKTNGGETEKMKEGINGGPAEKKMEAAVVREIPVKQLEEEGKPSQAQKIEERVSKVSDNHHVKNASSLRASKLPPVCLRVDPLPRKKTNGTSSSRSPSPPRQMKENKDKVALKAEENADASASKVGIETKAPKVGIETNKGQLQSNMQSKEAKATKKTEIGRDQAAVRIQAFYRGYQVRKFQSLRKLREIMKIRGRVEDLRQQMSSPNFAGEMSKDSKARGKFNETLMGLLLQLDTIQGLHPVVRDVRKSVARELITLQEKLDTLVEQACANRLQEAREKDKIAAAEKTEESITTSEGREIVGDTLSKTSGDDQQIESDKAINGENVEDKGSLKLGVLEVENKVTKDGEDAEEKADVKQDVLQVNNEAYPQIESDKVTIGQNVEDNGSIKRVELFEVENKATRDEDDVEEKAAVKQDVLQVKSEASKARDDLEEKAPIKQDESTTKEVRYEGGKYEEKVENVNQDSNGTGEKDLMLLPAEATRGNSIEEERDESGFSNVRLDHKKLLDSAPLKEDVDKEKLSSAPLGQEHGIADIENEKLLDSALPREEDAVKEKLSDVTLEKEKEQAIADIESEKPEDSAVPEKDVANDNLSYRTPNQEQAVVDIENEKVLDLALPKEEVVNEKLSSVGLEQEQAIEAIENVNAFETPAMVGQDNSIITAPEVEIDQEEIAEICEAPVSDRNEAIDDMENLNALAKPTLVGEDNSIIPAPEVKIDQEKIAEICEAPISDRNEVERDISPALTEECRGDDEMEFNAEVPSLTISHIIEDNNMARMEETAHSNENSDGEEPPAVPEIQSIGKPVETVNTADLSVQNEDFVDKKELLLTAFEQPVEGEESTLRSEVLQQTESGMADAEDEPTTYKQPVEGKESTLRCGEILQETESGMADIKDKPSIGSKCLADNKVQDTNKSGSKILQCEGKDDHEKWMEENEKLREMVEKLMSAGKRQMSTIIQLNDKIKQLENKLSQGKSKRVVRAGQLKLKSNVMATNKRNSTATGT